MFIIRFLRWLLGWVEFEAEGGFPERLLNLAARGGIPLWDTGRRGVVLTARCFARKYKKLRPIARKAGVRLHVVRRHGVPFFLHRYRARAGLVAGLATYVVLLQILSQQIWVMQVSGNRKVSEADILSVMEELGVHKGGRMKDLDIQALQIEALQKLPDLVWLTVNPEGAIAHIEVAERQPPPAVIDKSAPSNIKASRDGRIVRMEVYGGQAAVKEGDAVVRGMLLVSGVVDTSVGPVMRKSNAKIFAETSRSLEVSVPLKETKLLPDGYRILRPTFHLFQFGIPLYTDGPLEGEFQLQMSILKSADGDGDHVQRYFFDYPSLPAGEGRFLHTYRCDGDPIPSFEGEPERVALPEELDPFTALVWDNLDPENKVSLFTRSIDLASGETQSRIVNRNQ